MGHEPVSLLSTNINISSNATQPPRWESPRWTRQLARDRQRLHRNPKQPWCGPELSTTTATWWVTQYLLCHARTQVQQTFWISWGHADRFGDGQVTYLCVHFYVRAKAQNPHKYHIIRKFTLIYLKFSKKSKLVWEQFACILKRNKNVAEVYIGYERTTKHRHHLLVFFAMTSRFID